MSLGAHYLPHREARCKACGRPIVWAKTKHGRRMPVDRDPSDQGTLLLELVDDEVFATWVGPRALMGRHTSHFSTCPKADDFRKKRRG